MSILLLLSVVTEQVPAWSYAFAFTEGRQVVIPMPLQQANIVNVRANASYIGKLIGFGAYSEGAASDLNMMLWSYMTSKATAGSGITPTIMPHVNDVIAAYAEHFFTDGVMNSTTAAAVVSAVSQLLFGLEANWKGHPESNANIDSTFSTLQGLLELVNGTKSALELNWRLESYAYRANYDALIKTRMSYENRAVEQAYSTLSAARQLGVDAAIGDALALLDAPNDNPVLPVFLANMHKLYGMINDTIGLLSLQGQEPDLGLGNWNCSLGDLRFLSTTLHNISDLDGDIAKLAAIDELVTWTQCPTAGCFYDNLGDVLPEAHPRLDPGQGILSDPSYYFTPLQAFTGSNNDAGVGTMRASWRSFVQGFYDYHITLRYTDLDPTTPYTLRIVYFSDGRGGDSQIPYRLTANGDYDIHPYMIPPYPMRVLEFDLPAAVTANGSLVLECNQTPGTSGSGRCCQISETWLFPTPA